MSIEGGCGSSSKVCGERIKKTSWMGADNNLEWKEVGRLPMWCSRQREQHVQRLRIKRDTTGIQEIGTSSPEATKVYSDKKNQKQSTQM